METKHEAGQMYIHPTDKVPRIKGGLNTVNIEGEQSTNMLETRKQMEV